MDTNARTLLPICILSILANTSMTSGLSEDSYMTEMPVRGICNTSALLQEMSRCGEYFQTDMLTIDSKHWCNITYFIRIYNTFSYCTEIRSESLGCYWPNPVVENYIIHIHKMFFSNCTPDRNIWADPPDNMLAILILVPVVLTLAMVALVVWCSKRSDILA